MVILMHFITQLAIKQQNNFIQIILITEATLEITILQGVMMS